MSVLMVGIIFLGIGVVLLPFGIYFIKEKIETIKKSSPSKKLTAITLELLDVVTGPVFSGWLLYLSLLLIASGAVILILSS